MFCFIRDFFGKVHGHLSFGFISILKREKRKSGESESLWVVLKLLITNDLHDVKKDKSFVKFFREKKSYMR